MGEKSIFFYCNAVLVEFFSPGSSFAKKGFGVSFSVCYGRDGRAW